MKVIVCEICDYTEFTKENGFFVCQGCGCKYSLDEVKNLMKDSDDAVAQQNEEINNEPEEQEEENIPLHTLDSPNRITAKVIKVGHETYTVASVNSLNVLFGGEPQPVFADGPDQVGHIGAQIELQNLAGKTIKYANVFLKPYNAVNDQVGCTVQGHSQAAIEITGPLNVGDKWEGYADGLWYNNSITYALIDRVHVIYMDNTEELYKGEEFYAPVVTPVVATEPVAPPPAPNFSQNMSYITITRNQTALTTKTNKLNRLVCTLNTGEQFELGLGQTYSLPVKPGTYQITFDFWGKSLTPEKNKKTPVFQVNGTTYIELTVDPVMGGFKSTITQYQ